MHAHGSACNDPTCGLFKPVLCISHVALLSALDGHADRATHLGCASSTDLNFLVSGF